MQLQNAIGCQVAGTFLGGEKQHWVKQAWWVACLLVFAWGGFITGFPFISFFDSLILWVVGFLVLGGEGVCGVGVCHAPCACILDSVDFRVLCVGGWVQWLCLFACIPCCSATLGFVWWMCAVLAHVLDSVRSRLQGFCVVGVCFIIVCACILWDLQRHAFTWSCTLLGMRLWGWFFGWRAWKSGTLGFWVPAKYTLYSIRPLLCFTPAESLWSWCGPCLFHCV